MSLVQFRSFLPSIGDQNPRQCGQLRGYKYAAGNSTVEKLF